MGLQLAVTVGLGLWAGLWADRRWDWSPWGLLAGLALGSGTGLTVFLLEAGKLGREEEEDRRAEREEEERK